MKKEKAIASEALLKITRQIKTKEQQADRAFNTELEVAKSKGFPDRQFREHQKWQEGLDGRCRT